MFVDNMYDFNKHVGLHIHNHSLQLFAQKNLYALQNDYFNDEAGADGRVSATFSL